MAAKTTRLGFLCVLCVSALGSRYAQHFVERGRALAHPAKPVFAKAQHSLANRVRAQLALGGAVVDHVARLVVGHEELVDSGAALVAGEVAGTASDSAVDAIGHAAPEDRFLRRAGLVGRLALGAELAHQALCQ